MKVNGLKGNVYTPLWWGSYVTWELYPGVLVSMDGRNVTLFGRDQVTANFRFYSEERPDLDGPWVGTADYLLVPADTPGLGIIRSDRRWALLYDDQGAAMFGRAADKELTKRRERGDLRPPPAEVAAFFH